MEWMNLSPAQQLLHCCLLAQQRGVDKMVDGAVGAIVACKMWMVTSASSGSPKRWILSIDWKNSAAS